MAFLAHELHPSIVHLPLTLLPTAAVVDALAASEENRTSTGWDAACGGRWRRRV